MSGELKYAVGVDRMNRSDKSPCFLSSVRCSTWVYCNTTSCVQIVLPIAACERAFPAQEEVRVIEKNPLKVDWLFLFSWHCWLQLPTSTQRNRRHGCAQVQITDVFQNSTHHRSIIQKPSQKPTLLVYHNVPKHLQRLKRSLSPRKRVNFTPTWSDLLKLA